MPVKCDICNVFVKNLYAHNYKVHRERQYTCNVCDKKLKAKRNLQRHLKTHATKEKHVSPDSSSIMTNLVKEEPDKQEDVKSECDICSKVVGEKYLKHHMKNIHTDLKKIKCTYCNISYSNKNNLENHIYRKHLKQGSEKNTNVLIRWL